MKAGWVFQLLNNINNYDLWQLYPSKPESEAHQDKDKQLIILRVEKYSGCRWMV